MKEAFILRDCDTPLFPRRHAFSFRFTWFLMMLLVELPLSEPQSTSERAKVMDPRKPEPEIQQKIPNPSSQAWKTKKQGGQYAGHLFAARLGFNWIVDIRLQNQPVETSGSVGNLMSEKLILTSCRAGELYQKDMRLAIVQFGTLFLHERHTHSSGKDSFDSEGARGRRLITTVENHKKCSPGQIPWDVSVIEVDKPIFRFAPYIGYIPLPIDFSRGAIRSFDPVLRIERNQWICHVASFGRKSRNTPVIVTENYKVQYRVYPYPLSDCKKQIRLLCGSEDDCQTSDLIDESEIVCLGTRARVGSVCDSDRGAPVVCQGEVFGLVARGASSRYCNNLIHLPFFVQKMESLEEYFDQGLEDRVKKQKPLSHSNRVYPKISLFVHVVFIRIVTLTFYS